MEEGKYPISTISRLRMGIDGEGIRTLILVFGCPLRCKYCINPFTWDGTRRSENLTAKEVYERVQIDRLYMLATNGGVTFGGGEPLLYPELIREFRDICNPDLTIYVETSLNVDWRNIELLLDVVDRFYVDIKTMATEIYAAYTEGELSLVTDNLEKLIHRRPEDIVARIPVIPGYTDKSSQRQSQKVLRRLGVKHFNLFDYRVPYCRS